MKGKQSKFAASGSFFFFYELTRAGWLGERGGAVIAEHSQLRSNDRHKQVSIHVIWFLITCQRRGLKIVFLWRPKKSACSFPWTIFGSNVSFAPLWNWETNSAYHANKLWNKHLKRSTVMHTDKVTRSFPNPELFPLAQKALQLAFSDACFVLGGAFATKTVWNTPESPWIVPAHSGCATQPRRSSVYGQRLDSTGCKVFPRHNVCVFFFVCLKKKNTKWLT